MAGKFKYFGVANGGNYLLNGSFVYVIGFHTHTALDDWLEVEDSRKRVKPTCHVISGDGTKAYCVRSIATGRGMAFRADDPVSLEVLASTEQHGGRR